MGGNQDCLQYVLRDYSSAPNRLAEWDDCACHQVRHVICETRTSWTQFFDQLDQTSAEQKSELSEQNKNFLDQLDQKFAQQKSELSEQNKNQLAQKFHKQGTNSFPKFNLDKITYIYLKKLKLMIRLKKVANQKGCLW